MHYSSIQITKDFKQILKDMKLKGQSYETIIRNLIASHEQLKLDKLEKHKDDIQQVGSWNEAKVPATGRIRLTKAADMVIQWRIKE